MKSLLNKYNLLSVAAKASIVYVFASLLTNGLHIITMPIFTRIMTVEQIGVINTFSSWNSILYVIVTLSLSTGGFSVAMVDYSDKRDQYQSSVLFLSTISTIIFGILYFFLHNLLNPMIKLGPHFMVLMFLNFLFQPALDFWLQRNRFEYNYKNVAFLTVIMAIVSSFVSILFVLFGEKIRFLDIPFLRLLGQYCIVFLFAFFIYIKTIKRGKTFFNRSFWKFALTVNLPLIIHALAKHILDVSDRIMISNMIGLKEVGIYGTLYSISTLSIIVWSAINASILPYTFEKLKKKKYGDINKILVPIILLYGLICIFLSLISPEIVLLLTTKEFFKAIYLMPPVASGIFMISVYNIYSNVLLYYKKTPSIMISTIIAATVNVILNYIFIKKYGFVAASYTTLFSYYVLALMQFLFLKINKIETGYNNKLIFSVSGIVIILCLLTNFLYSNFIIRYLIILILFFLLYFYRNKIKNLIIKLKNEK